MTLDNTTMTGGQPAVTTPQWRTCLGLYLVLLATQTAGAVILLIKRVPICRQIASDFANHEAQAAVLWWAVAAVSCRIALPPVLL